MYCINLFFLFTLCWRVVSVASDGSVTKANESTSDAFQNSSVSSPESENHSTTSPPDIFHFENGPLIFLDKMLRKYDRRAWPSYGTHKPTVVSVNMYVNSLGSINAANMKKNMKQGITGCSNQDIEECMNEEIEEFSGRDLEEFGMDIYLRQSWYDPRLGLSRYGINHVVTLNGQGVIENIWQPDLFFRNLKAAKFHTVTVPNKLVRLSPNGTVLYSMRLTLRLSCHMTFRQYPLDAQRCWVVLGSYAQTTDQVLFKWKDENPITIENDIELPEFDMIPQPPGAFKREIDTGSFSFLNVSFVFVRQNGYHLVQTYLPTFLIVTISWVSFWLHVDATPARVTLGVTTLLTLTTVASGVRTQLPPVSYVKAIDVWIGACSVMVFGALLEFTLVNYLSRWKSKRNETKNGLKSIGKNKQVLELYKSDEEKHQVQLEDNKESAAEMEKKACVKRALTVDRTSRVLFPLIFFIFNVAYWVYYLHLSRPIFI